MSKKTSSHLKNIFGSVNTKNSVATNNFGKRTLTSLFNLKNVTSSIDGGIVTDVSVNLDYAEGIDPTALAGVIPIGNFIEDFLANYSVEAGFYEVLNRDLTEGLLNNSELGLSRILNSLSVNLDVEPKIIPFQFDSTNTRTPNGKLNDIISFNLEDVTSPIDGGIVTDVRETPPWKDGASSDFVNVHLDYVEGIDSTAFKDVIPIGNFIEDYLRNYSNHHDSFEVANNNLGTALLTNCKLKLSEVLDSLTVTLDISLSVIPFQFENTITLTLMNEEICHDL